MGPPLHNYSCLSPFLKFPPCALRPTLSLRGSESDRSNLYALCAIPFSPRAYSPCAMLFKADTWVRPYITTLASRLSSSPHHALCPVIARERKRPKQSLCPLRPSPHASCLFSFATSRYLISFTIVSFISSLGTIISIRPCSNKNSEL